jgi:hypothetical protein
MPDVQILAGGVTDAPLGYKIPQAQEIILKSLFASFDGTNASGDFLPCIRVLSPAGKVIGEFFTDAAVVAGDSAEVTFAPFLRNASAATVLTSGLFWGRIGSGAGAQSIPSGAVTLLETDAFTAALGSQPPLATDAFGNVLQPFELSEYRVWVQTSISWPAGAYDRYVEFAPTGTVTGAGEIGLRARGSATPDADIQVVGGVLGGNPAAPVALNLQAFQSSGAPKLVTGGFIAYGWPRVLGAFYG